MIRSQRNNHVHVIRRVERIAQRRRRPCPDGRSCNIIDNFPCRQFDSCLCIGIPFIPGLNGCLDLSLSQISNANVHFRRDGAIYFTPSKYLQYSIISTPRKGRTIVRTFRFKIRNKNRKSFTIQNLNRKGKLVNKRFTFKEANAGCMSCRKKRRK